MLLRRLFVWGMAVVFWGLPLFWYFVSIRSLGFPDGHLTPLDRAEKVLFWVSGGGSFFWGLGLVWFGRRLSREPEGKRALWLAGLALFWLLCTMVVGFFLQATLPHGQGG
ncbi:MAG: hypothetical protein H6727_17055 [Myxococcales bacterium]|nr:hypothetical protein [Myxococcales bacterium]